MTTVNRYDGLGRIYQVETGYGTSAAALEVTKTFTANGQVQTVKDAQGNLTSYQYDGYDRLFITAYPDPATPGLAANCASGHPCDVEIVGSWNGSAWVPGYDANGNVTSFRTRRGEILTLSYDNLNRLVTKRVPERSGLAATHTRDVYFGYDLAGNMTYARFDSAGGEGITNAFNALGQLTSTTTNMDGVSRALLYYYDAGGNFIRLAHPDGNYINYHRSVAVPFTTPISTPSRRSSIRSATRRVG